MINRAEIEKIIAKHGYSDFKWINSDQIVVAQWVRMKCLFGCSSYGQKAACPPNVPTVSECREFFSEYRECVIFHFEKQLENPEDRFDWSKNLNSSLLKLERKIFLSGYKKAFLLFMDECCICKKCPGNRIDCKRPKSARPCAEGLAIDVFTTAKSVGYPIEVLQNYDQKMNRYAFLLID